MAPTISTALIMTVLFTAFILFNRTTLDNNLEISQAMNEAAELAGERARTNIRMMNVNVSDFCDIEATVINEGTTDISDFKNMSLIVDFPDEVAVNNDSISLNYTSGSLSVIFGNTSPIFALIIGYLFLKEKISIYQLFGILVSLGGILLVIIFR